MPEEAPQSPFWRWPGEWARSQSFWRDVATRTVAGVIVVFLVWATGIATGLIAQPAVVAAFLHVLQGIAIITLVLTSVMMISTARRARKGTLPDALILRARGADRSRDLRLTSRMFFSLGVTGLLASTGITLDLILNITEGR